MWLLKLCCHPQIPLQTLISLESMAKINCGRQGGCFVKGVLFEINCKMNCLWLQCWGFFLSWLDAPAGDPENRWPDHPFFPSLHRNVCWDQLSSPGRATAQSCSQPHYDSSQVLPQPRCLCATHCTAGEALWGGNQHSHKDQSPE